MKTRNVGFVYIPTAAARPASAAMPMRSKRWLSSTSQTVIATIAASGASSMKTWNMLITSGAPSANSTASSPAVRPNASFAVP